jgi:CRP-like cAMP-binding protein
MKLLAHACVNTLLNSLPKSDLANIISDCNLINLQAGEVIYDSGEEIHSIIFPIDCIVSLTYETLNGKSSEIVSIGNTGVVGSEILLSKDSSQFRAFTIHPGYAYKINTNMLRQKIEESEAFSKSLLNYIATLLKQVAFNSICNNLHSINQRVCKFLLVCGDLVSSELYFTHETIAYLLGVRRESVTAAVYNLSKTGIIQNVRGYIRILDFQALEKRSCECHQLARSQQALKVGLQCNN